MNDERKDISDVEIHPDIIEAWEKEREAVERLEQLEDRVLEHSNNELERMLVRAVHFGHDFMDVRVDEFGNVEYEGWDEGHEPPYGWLDEPSDRYDLRGVNYEDIRRAHERHR